MRNKTRRKTIVIDGVHYFADKPETCRKCFFWKNRKAGCILGTENCYYLAEVIKTEQETKCENCCYVISVGFDRPGVIFDYHLMPIASQVRNFMLSRRTQRVIL